MVVSLWMQVTENLYWWTFEVKEIGRLLVERAYHYPAVAYVNITELEQLLIEEVLKNNRRGAEKIRDDYFWGRGFFKNYLFREYFMFLPDKIIGWSRFERRVEDEKVSYYNEFREQGFYEKDLVEKEGNYFVKEVGDAEEEEALKNLTSKGFFEDIED